MSLLHKLLAVLAVGLSILAPLAENHAHPRTFKIHGANEADQLAASDFLQRYEWIRILLENTPGMGHQAHSFQILTKIRLLGFRGWIEIYYEPSYNRKNMEDNLKVLIPKLGQDFSTLHKTLYFEEEKIRLTNGLISPGQPVAPLTVLGGYDQASKWGIRYRDVLVLQPPTWPSNNYFFLQDPLRPTVSGKTLNDTILKESLGHFFSLNHLRDHPNYSQSFIELHRDLTRDPKAIHQVKNDILKYILSNDFSDISSWTEEKLKSWFASSESLVVYGNSSVQYNEKIHLYINAFLKAQSTSQDPLKRNLSVILLNDDATSLIFREEFKKMYLLESKKNQSKVQLFHLGKVPQHLFEKLILYSSLPPLLSGVNSRSLMSEIGKPYLMTTPKRPTHLFELTLSGARNHSEIKSKYFSKWLQFEQDFLALTPQSSNGLKKDLLKRLSDYLIDHQNPNSLLKKLFEKKKVTLLDRTILALSKAERCHLALASNDGNKSHN